MKKNKVVYNTSFGGFGLSDEAVRWLEYNAKDEKVRNFLQAERERVSKLDKKGLYGFTVENLMQSSLKYDFKILRHHPDLIKVVETLKRKADGDYAELAIAKINGNLYRIDEYDGAETVIEPEDYKWININD